MSAFFRSVVFALPLVLVGCGGSEPSSKARPRELPSVVTQPAVASDVLAMIEYVGRSEASKRVEIRARVSGVLLDRPFKEGGEVAAGALMFRIDPAEYEANRDSAKASVAKADAIVEEASANLARYQELLKRDAASVAKFEQSKAKDATARAELAAAKAALQKAQLDLDYTKITSPIAGRSSRAKVDVGNLIEPNGVVLATVVQLDPIRVIFSIGEREYLNYAQRNRIAAEPTLTPRIKLANDRAYEHAGTFDLIDNEVDPATGTINIRVTFPNPDRLILPGQFVNVILTNKKPEKRILIPQAAIQENQTGPFVLVVDSEDRVSARPIKTGQRVGPAIVALEGLDAGETIVVEGIQKVRPGAKVKTTQREPRKASERKSR
jgi:membrane fusion protein (multidrug efflux system)